MEEYIMPKKKMPKKLNQFKIPKDCKTYDEKIEFMIEEIEDAYEDCGRTEKTAVEHAVRLGRWCIIFKKLVKKHKKGKWEETMKNHLPHLSIRTVQRYMKLAWRVDLEAYPVLAFLGQTRLYALIGLTGKTKIHEFLLENDVDIEIDLAEEDAKDRLHGFRLEVEELMDGLEEGKSDEKENGDQGNDPGDDDPKKKPKAVSTRTIEDLGQSANSFIKTIDSVMKNKKEITTKLREIDKIIEEVEGKLATLKKLRESLEADGD
jgi:hypothetical protein